MLTRKEKNDGVNFYCETGNNTAEPSSSSTYSSNHDFDRSLSESSSFSNSAKNPDLKKEEGDLYSQNDGFILVDDLRFQPEDTFIPEQISIDKNNFNPVRLDGNSPPTKTVMISDIRNKGYYHERNISVCPSCHYSLGSQGFFAKSDVKNQKFIFWLILSLSLIVFALLYSNVYVAHEMRIWRRKAISFESEAIELRQKIDNLRRQSHYNDFPEQVGYAFALKNSWVLADVRVSLGDRGYELNDSLWKNYDDLANILTGFYDDFKNEITLDGTRNSDQIFDNIIDPFDKYKKKSLDFIKRTSKIIGDASLVFTEKEANFNV